MSETLNGLFFSAIRAKQREQMADIALALGGGGVKGIAHLGVIRRLEKEGYTIRAVAGTSIGGLVGAIYAAGYSVSEIEKIFESVDRSKLFARSASDGASLLGLSGLTHTVLRFLGDRNFEDLKIPFACTAVDLYNAQEVILSQGCVVDAVLGTIAVPGVFPPKDLEETRLIDGAVMDPVPVALARWLAPSLPVIAVVLTPVPEGWRHLPPLSKMILPATSPIPMPIIEQFSKLRVAQAFDVFTRSIDITSLVMAELRLQVDKPDAVIRPEVYQFGMLDEVDPEEMVWLGDKAAAAALKQIKESLAWHKRLSRRFQRVNPPGKIFRGKKSLETKGI
jgi:NTE family protein